MIVLDKKPSWLSQVFTFKGTALKVVWKRVLFTTLLALFVTLAHEAWDIFKYSLTPLPFSLMGLALSIYLGFRNNTGYDRYWEGRKLWGRMVNVSRTFARQVQSLVRDPEGGDASEVHKRLTYLHIGYVHNMRQHLRDENERSEIAEFAPADLLDKIHGHKNRPISMLNEMGRQLRELYDRGWIDSIGFQTLESSLTEMTGVQGACERIKSTPIPFSYTVLMHRIVLIYCVGLPFGIVSSIHMLTPVVVMIVAYAFYGLDAVGTEIENPFNHDANDLPLSALSRMIEVNLREDLGETELPPLLQPHNNILH